jgi:hypothetical protein
MAMTSMATTRTATTAMATTRMVSDLPLVHPHPTGHLQSWLCGATHPSSSACADQQLHVTMSVGIGMV